MNDPEDRFELQENSQSVSLAMFWKTKLGVLVIVTGLSAVVLLIGSGLMYGGVAKLSSFEGMLRNLDNDLKNKSINDVTTVAPTTQKAPLATCPVTEDKDKFDCQPDSSGDEAKCLARGCCWAPKTQTPPTYADPAPVNVPQCFFPAYYAGYKVDNVAPRADGLDFVLIRQYPSVEQKTGLRDEVTLAVKVTNYNYNTARIEIKSAYKDRWIPPVPPIAEQSTERDVGYKVELDDTKRKLSVYRLKRDMKREDTPVFSINLATLIFADQYIQVSSPLPSNDVYGLGDMKGPLKHSVNWTRRMMFNKDQPPRFNRALYGAHPFMLTFDKNNNANGVFLKNSNAMDAVLQPQPAVTFRTLGGILDFFVFVGPTPNEVFSQYHQLIGLPAMQPYWSLGYHLCRYGIFTLNATEEVYDRNVKAQVPLEVQWNDIDYMDRYNMFTYDANNNFSGLPNFIKKIHDDDRRYVMIFDPAVSGSEADGTYLPYDRGMKMDIFVKNINNQVAKYKVWNLHTSIFPDFSNPRTEQYWKEMYEDFYDRQGIQFDGAWIDMNEPSNQKNGTLEGCPKTLRDFPPIVIGGEPLFTYTCCMSDKLHQSDFYDLHNLYAHLEARATYKALTTIRPNKRPLIISRSSSPGQGHWGGHWTGDIDSTWGDMHQSVTDIINFAMFGMPMVGADICGFQYNTTDELCARWQALGAFYPFSRNHNDINQRNQDPAAMGKDTLRSTINTLRMKYLFAPFLYTLLYRAHIAGETVFRAMMFNFPEDTETHAIDDQFMWGDGLLIVPALTRKLTVEPYLPMGVWYHYNDNGTKIVMERGGRGHSFPAPIDDINLLLRGGNILPAQDTLGHNLSGNRKSGFILFVAPDHDRTAKGQLFWDDGETLDTVEKGEYCLINFAFSHNTITISAQKSNYVEDPMELRTIHVFGVETQPNQLWINGTPKASAANYFKYEPESKHLEIINLDIKLRDVSSSIFFA